MPVSECRLLFFGWLHASQGETLTARVVTTLKQRALLNDSPSAGYLERKWPEPFKKSGAWPLLALRQAFLNDTLERVLDPDTYLCNRLPEFVMRGDMGFASGHKPEGWYSRVWFAEMLPPDEIAFDSDVYLLLPRIMPGSCDDTRHSRLKPSEATRMR